ncbi:MAG: HepT-like ribonuclease domain-containing protein, partial [Alphaproteobacteria bacterium]
MAAACDTIADFIANRKRKDLDSDRMLLFALVRAVEIIGEAAARVSDETRAGLPDIPWQQIVSMRNRLIHAYFDIDRDVLWIT